VVDLSWRGGKLERATIRSKRGQPGVVRHGDCVLSLELGRGEALTLTPASFE
jgi:hypothetical protein